MRPLTTLLSLGLLHVALAASGKDKGEIPESAKRKNIVFILTDDQDVMLDSVSHMPLLQRHIIDQGTTFANHFTNTAICCPARVTILTGRYSHNHNITDVKPPYGGYPKFVKNCPRPSSNGTEKPRLELRDSDETSNGDNGICLNNNYLPIWLQSQGYSTYYTGKLFNAHSLDNYNDPFANGWDGNDFLLDPSTYSYWNPVYQKNHDAPVHYKNEHTTDLIQAKTRRLLADAIDSGKPFFMGIAPIAPHSEIDDKSNNGTMRMTIPIPLLRHQNMFEDVKVPRTSNFNPDENSGVGVIRNISLLSQSSIEYIDEFHRARLGALQGVDELVEQVVKQLDDAGILDNTYIIYTSDNGFHLGQYHLPPGKTFSIDEDIRVPFFIRGPGITPGRVEKAVTQHVDLSPTILKLAGADGRDEFDGAPLPVFEDEESTLKREHVLTEFWGGAIAEGDTGGFDGKGTYRLPGNTHKSLRIVNDKYDLHYIVWCSGEHELYDVKSDPDRIDNLWGYGKDAGRRDKLARPFLGTTLGNVVNRLDALLLLLKTCDRCSCSRPWQVIHNDPEVDSLFDALDAKYDGFYAEKPKVSFDGCDAGYRWEAEFPQFEKAS